MNSAQIRTLRGDILQFLYNIGSSNASESSIIQAYYEYYKPEDIRRALSYLKDSGLIICEERNHPVYKLMKEKFYHIAPSGMDLVDGTIENPGIAVVTES